MSHRTFDHTSILKFIEWRFGLPALTPRDAAANNLGEALLFLREPNLEAPQWDVPTADDARARRRQRPDGQPGRLPAPRRDRRATEHEAEWLGLAELADQYGFPLS